MRCEEVHELLRELAPTKDRCLTKSEIRALGDYVRSSGISGTRIRKCIDSLLATGEVKESEKCVKRALCYYDPPTSLNSDLLIAALVGGSAFVCAVVARWMRRKNEH